MSYDEELSAAKQGLKMAAGFCQLFMDLKDTEDMQTIHKAIPDMAAEFKPFLEALSRFFVQMDIDAIKMMEDAGIERHYAVALCMRRSPKQGIALGIGDAIKSKKTTRR